MDFQKKEIHKIETEKKIAQMQLNFQDQNVEFYALLL